MVRSEDDGSGLKGESIAHLGRRPDFAGERLHDNSRVRTRGGVTQRLPKPNLEPAAIEHGSGRPVAIVAAGFHVPARIFEEPLEDRQVGCRDVRVLKSRRRASWGAPQPKGDRPPRLSKLLPPKAATGRAQPKEGFAFSRG